MKVLDIILLIPLIYGMYDGYKKGFILVVIGSLGLILGIIGGFKLIQVGIDFLMNYFPHMPKLLPLLSFILIFFLIFAGMYLLGVAIKKTLGFTIFAGVLDNIMGAAVGLFQWAFSLSILIWLIKQSHLLIPVKYTRESVVFNYLDDLAPYVVRVFDFIIPVAHDLFKSIKEIF